MKFSEAIRMIKAASPHNECKDLKAALLTSDEDIYEAVADSVYHNGALIKDAMNRTGRKIEDLVKAAKQLWRSYPDSYRGDNREFAIWDAADNYVLEVISRTKRLNKRM